MRVHSVRLVQAGGGCAVRAAVVLDTPWVWGSEPFPLWFRFPDAVRDFLSMDNGDPLLAACLPPAMVLGEPLEIEAPVSGRLLDALPKLQSTYCSFDRRLVGIEVRAPRRQEPLPAGRVAEGLFCSLGVDSTYSLLENADTVTHLINVLGFDLDLWETEVHQRVVENMALLGRGLGKKVLTAATNLRDLSDRIVDWPAVYHGAALASVGLVLGAAFRRIRIAASQTSGLVSPWGSHPDLDPLWSTEGLEFVHDGLKAGRLEKIRRVAASDEALRHLRVCAADKVGTDYNCGRCDKCLRTSVGLYVAGALERCPTLPHGLDLDRVARIRPGSAFQQAYVRQLIAELGETGADCAVRAALCASLEGGRGGGPCA